MDLIKDLKPFEKELGLYRGNNTLPQGQVKNALADIYEKHYHNNKKWGVSKVTRNCPSCISDFMRCLTAEWFNRTVEFKGVPQNIKAYINNEEQTIVIENTKNSIDIVAHVTWKELDAIDKLEVETPEDSFDNVRSSFVHNMKWAEFKAYCKEQGLKTYKKTREQLMEELNGI